MKTREHQLAWAAGIIDGEGCIFISAGESLRVRVSVTNTDIRMIDELKSLFGGNAHCRIRKGKPSYKPQWDWEVAATKAEFCLNQILPFLVCKKDQAEMALLARSYTLKRGANSHGAQAIEARSKQLLLKTNISLLKQKIGVN